MRPDESSRDLDKGESVLRVVHASVWTGVAPNAGNVLASALVDAEAEAIARQVVAASPLPVSADRAMLVALTDRHIIVWEKIRLRRRLRLLGKLPLDRIEGMHAHKGATRQFIAVIALLFLLIAAVLLFGDRYGKVVAGALLLACMAACGLAGAINAMSCNALCIDIAPSARVRLSVGLNDDPEGFVSAFEQQRKPPV